MKMLVEEKEEIAPADAKLAVGKKPQQHGLYVHQWLYNPYDIVSKDKPVFTIFSKRNSVRLSKTNNITCEDPPFIH